MNGIAERQINSISRQITSFFEIGDSYPTSEIEKVLGYKPGGADRKGVLGGFQTDYLVLKITFQKIADMNDDYYDHILGTTLFWSSQRNRRFAEQCACDGRHDVFIFVRESFGDNFVYYGRAIPLRVHFSTEKDKASVVVFDLPEYANSQLYLKCNENMYSYDKEDFRSRSLRLWNYYSSVGNVYKDDFLITRHIKPLREATENEANDPANSLVLTPNLDNLFYRGIISFSDTNGRILLPESINERIAIETMNINSSLELNDIPSGTDAYLRYHQTYIWGYDSCCHEWKYR